MAKRDQPRQRTSPDPILTGLWRFPEETDAPLRASARRESVEARLRSLSAELEAGSARPRRVATPPLTARPVQPLPRRQQQAPAQQKPVVPPSATLTQRKPKQQPRAKAEKAPRPQRAKNAKPVRQKSRPQKQQKQARAPQPSLMAAGKWDELFDANHSFSRYFDKWHLFGIRTLLLDIPLTLIPTLILGTTPASAIRNPLKIPLFLLPWATAKLSWQLLTTVSGTAFDTVRVLWNAPQIFQQERTGLDRAVASFGRNKRAGALSTALAAAAMVGAVNADMKDYSVIPGASDAWRVMTGTELRDADFSIVDAVKGNLEEATTFGLDIVNYGHGSATLLNFGGTITIQNGERSITIDQTSPLFDPFARLGQGAEIVIGESGSPVLFTTDMNIEFTFEGLQNVLELGDDALTNSYVQNSVVSSFDFQMFTEMTAAGMDNNIVRAYVDKALERNPDLQIDFADLRVTWTQIDALLRYAYTGDEYTQASIVAAAVFVGVRTDDVADTNYFLGVAHLESTLGLSAVSHTGAGGPYHFIPSTAREQGMLHRAELETFARVHMGDEALAQRIARAESSADFYQLMFNPVIGGYAARLYHAYNERCLSDNGVLSRISNFNADFAAHNSGCAGATSLLRARPGANAYAVVGTEIAENNTYMYGEPGTRVSEVLRNYRERPAEHRDLALAISARLLGDNFAGSGRMSLASLQARNGERIDLQQQAARAPREQMALNR